MSIEAQNDLDLYFQSMKNGDVEICIMIEEKYHVFGLPPNLVAEEIRSVISADEEATNDQ